MDPEELYPPRPGGMVDTARKAAAQAQPDEDAVEVLDGGYPAVRVDDVAPESAGTRTVVVSTATGVKRLLPMDSRRRRAVVLAVDQAVVITPQRTQADDPSNAATAAGLPAAGFVLPAGIPVVLWASCEWYVSPTSGTAGRVSVISDLRAG